MAKPRLPYRTTLVNYHLPLPLAEKIDDLHKATGKPKVRIAIEAFEAYLRNNGSGSRPTFGYNAELDEDA